MSVETHPEAHHAQPLPGTPEYDAEPVLLHQFDDLQQQTFSSNLAMWTFLATEVMFFGGLILAFIVYRTMYHETFVAAARWLNVPLGGFNTVVLLTSSLTMAMAVRASHLRQKKATCLYLVATMVLGASFLVVKGFEWYADYEEKLIPGLNFEWHGSPEQAHQVPHSDAAQETHATPFPDRPTAHDAIPHAAGAEPPGIVGPDTEPNYAGEESEAPTRQRAQLFFVLYFFMTGLHALHMIIGLAVVGVLTYLIWTGWVSGTGSTQVEVTGLYWHFVDIVWVYLYPLLYLIDRH